MTWIFTVGTRTITSVSAGYRYGSKELSLSQLVLRSKPGSKTSSGDAIGQNGTTTGSLTGSRYVYAYGSALATLAYGAGPTNRVCD